MLYIHLNIGEMTIEEEIKQVRFKDEYHKLVVNLQFTANWLRSLHAKNLRKFQVSPQQYNVLRILKGQYPKPSSLLLIRERMLDKESNASRLIDKLITNGLVERVQCPNDRRQVEITITHKGLQLVEDMDPEINQVTNKLKCISEVEANQLNNLLDSLRSN